MASTTSGQFHQSNMGQEYDAGSVVVSGSNLYYLVPGGSNQVKVDVCNIASLQAGDVSSVNSNSKWSTFNVKDKVPTSNGASFKTSYRPAAVLLGTSIYFFWVDQTGNQVFAVSMDALGNFSSMAFKVYKSSSSALTASSYLSANVSPNGEAIVLNWFDTSALTLQTLVLDPQNMNTSTRQWAGSTGTAIAPKSFGASQLNSNYSRISTVWFSQGNLGNFMIASFYSSNDHYVYSLLYPLNENGTPAYADSNHVFALNGFSARRGFTMSRDPAGRIVGIFCKNDDNAYVYTTTFNTYQTVEQDNGRNPSLSWGSSSLLNGVSKDSEKCPVLAFVTGTAVANQSTTLPTTSGSSRTFPCTSIPQYSFALYADDNGNSNSSYDIQCQVALYGTSQIVPSYNTYPPNSQHASDRVLAMVMDSFPFPNENIGSATPNASIAKYTYGTSSTTELSASMSLEFLFGMRASFTTTKGIGPAADVEFKTGPQGSFGASTATTEFRGFWVNTTPIAAPIGSSTPLKIESHGEYFGETLSSIVEDIAIFRDTGNTIVNGQSAPLFSQLRPVPIGSTSRVSGQYGTYCYTPGNIQSYQQSSIDDTMARLYNALSASDKALLEPGYASGYIENVIIPNAQTLANGSNCLQFTIDGSGGSGTDFQRVNQILATIGWTVQGSAYVGVSGGEELSIFGAGEGFEASALGGFEYNFTITGGVTQTSTWGITWDYDALNNVPGAYAYTVRMYICKPSNLWARELQLFAPDLAASSAVDFEGSAPTKVMFVVSNIQSTLPPSK